MDMRREKVVAKYEADCARLANEPWLIDSLTAERDRLAAENAELRWRIKESELAMMEAQQNEDFANATLDALRERLPEYDTGPEDWEFGDLMRCVADFHAILYPQPAALAEENDNG